MDINGTGSQYWPLLTGTTNQPGLTQGAVTAFSCNTVPDRCPTGPLAYYLPYAELTIYGNLVQPATSGSPVTWDTLKACLIDSVDWAQTFFGSVVSSKHFKGSSLPIIEYVSGGGRSALPAREPFPSAAGTYPFELTVAIPAATCRLGNLLGNTSNLALLFQTSSINVNVAAAGVLAGVSTGATFTNLSAQCSVKLVPSAELVLGTPIEWVRTEINIGGSTNASQIQIRDFGTDTQLSGMEANKGGVLWLGALTNVGLLGGSFAAETVTQYQFDWAAQTLTYHMEAIVSDAWNVMPVSRSQAFPTVVTGGDAQLSSFPYANGTSNQPTTTSSKMDRKGLLAWIMRQAGSDAQLTDVQTADSDKTFNLTTSAARTGVDLILGAFARAPSQGLRDKWLGQVIKGGTSSLAAYVLGQNYMDAVSKPRPDGTVGMRQRVPKVRHQTTADQYTYLPWQLAY